MFLKGKYFAPKEMILADFLYLVFTGLYDGRKYFTVIEPFASRTYILSEQAFEDGMPTESAMSLAFALCVYIILYVMSL